MPSACPSKQSANLNTGGQFCTMARLLVNGLLTWKATVGSQANMCGISCDRSGIGPGSF